MLNIFFFFLEHQPSRRESNIETDITEEKTLLKKDNDEIELIAEGNETK